MASRVMGALVIVVAGLLGIALPTFAPDVVWTVGPFGLPEGTRIVYRLEMPGKDIASGRGPFDDHDFARHGIALESSVQALGIADAEVQFDRSRRFLLWLPPGTDLAEVRRHMARALGSEVSFRIEVRPDDALPRHEAIDRKSVWVGARSEPQPPRMAETFAATTMGFDAFKAREIERWNDARKKGDEYLPLDPRYRLVPKGREDREESTAHPLDARDFAVLQEPSSAVEREMGSAILANVRPGLDAFGSRGVSFDVKPDYQRALHDWTEKNVGLPMAIVVNGFYDQAPTINSPLEDSVIITLGGSTTVDAALRRQRELVDSLQRGLLNGRLVEVASEDRAPPPHALYGRRRRVVSVLVPVSVAAAVYFVFTRRRRPSPAVADAPARVDEGSA